MCSSTSRHSPTTNSIISLNEYQTSSKILNLTDQVLLYMMEWLNKKDLLSLTYTNHRYAYLNTSFRKSKLSAVPDFSIITKKSRISHGDVRSQMPHRTYSDYFRRLTDPATTFRLTDINCTFSQPQISDYGIPISDESFPNLMKIYCSFEEVVSQHYFPHLSKLKELQINNNNVSNLVISEEEIGSLNERDLYITWIENTTRSEFFHFADIDGPSPNLVGIKKIQGLRHLTWITDEYYTGHLKVINHFIQLTSLTLKGFNFLEEPEFSLSALVHLKALELISSAGITIPLKNLPFLKECRNLTIRYPDEEYIFGIPLEDLSNTQQLEKLTLEILKSQNLFASFSTLCVSLAHLTEIDLKIDVLTWDEAGSLLNNKKIKTITIRSSSFNLTLGESFKKLGAEKGKAVQLLT